MERVHPHTHRHPIRHDRSRVRPRGPAVVAGVVLLLASVTISVSACGGGSSGDGGGDGGGDGDGVPAAIRTVPEFVNRLVPGRRPAAIVERTAGSGVLTLRGTTDVDGVEVVFIPERIDDGATVAEVWLEVPDDAGALVRDEEQPITVEVAATAPGGDEATTSFTATLVAGVDDLASTARELVTLFLPELARRVDGVPTDVDALGDGTPLAGLLVVSHYAWFVDDWEIDLSWHVMIAPDDWSEVVLRPRDAAHPTRAFRISSWSTALAEGSAQIEEIPPPADVMR